MIYSKEDIERARNTDIMDFISTKYGTSFVRQGSYYRCKSEEMSSLIIGKDGKKWFWNSHSVNGSGAIDWLIKVENMDFKAAVGEILGNSYSSAVIEERQAKKNGGAFTGNYDDIPKRYYDRSYKAAKDYLHCVRGISLNVIDQLMSADKIYQDTHYNVVFANLNDKGKVGYWCLRGTHKEKKFTRNMAGSNNPFYGFEVDSKTPSDTLYVFEAPIDLLSHCTISEIKFGKDSWQNENRLALCGVNDAALESYLARHGQGYIKNIKFCLDNDGAGKTATAKLLKKYYELGYKTSSIVYKPNSGKDLNEALCNYLKADKVMNSKEAPKKDVSQKSTSGKENLKL